MVGGDAESQLGRHNIWIRVSSLWLVASIVIVVLAIMMVSENRGLAKWLFGISIFGVTLSLGILIHQQGLRDKLKAGIDTYNLQLQHAQNLERARDWANAAAVYQSLGLLDRAAQIRQQFTEPSPVSTNIHVGRIGDTVLNDSVIGELNEPHQSRNPPYR